MRSNVTIAPNIYVRESVDVQNDDEFVKRVYGHKALNILKTRFSKTYASRFTRAQVEEMKQNVICRHGKTREHAYGKALLEDGKIVWSCRCENVNCYAYDKCMNLPNALRIVRKDLSATEIRDGYEFESDEDDADVFEPPASALTSLNLKETPRVEKAAETRPATKPVPYAETYRPPVNKRVLVICDNPYETGYFSTILYKNKVKHRVLRAEGYTLNRRIADIFWDYCDEIIEKDAFFDRCLVRLGLSEAELTDFYEALFRLCGDALIGDEGGLKASGLADALTESPELISACVLNMDDGDFPVTLCVLGTLTTPVTEKDYDEVLYLEGQNAASTLIAAENLFGLRPALIRKESASGWLFSKSELGRPYRISLNNYTGVPGRHCLNVELGLWGDVDGKCFLTDQIGDALRLQNYISEKIREGDELTIDKNAEAGGYWFRHDGNVLGRVPDAIIREMRSIEGFPDGFMGFEGVYVRHIVTCLSEKGDDAIPLRFSESRVWLGLDVTGYAKVLI